MKMLNRLIARIGKPPPPPLPSLPPLSVPPKSSGARKQYEELRDKEEFANADKEIFLLTRTLREIGNRGQAAGSDDA